ncbi:hypothetical protein H6H03_00575 [Nostoc paludosum FACHB-159]|uniref:Uncharacterized protein n=1 Tax=Nostoc paludosum FACHB-159 TaxID=2692908 RepID=A0ABR8K033_9NOSO|nr:hypothetical protein [Nostoc paludosum FACHB-159]
MCDLVGDRLSKIYEITWQLVKILLNDTVFKINSSFRFYLIDINARHHDLTFL